MPLSSKPKSPAVIRKLRMLPGLPTQEIERLHPVLSTFTFRVPPYYSRLIKWDDPNDPLRRIVLPSPEELRGGEGFDPSNELENTKVRGVQHIVWTYRAAVSE